MTLPSSGQTPPPLPVEVGEVVGQHALQPGEVTVLQPPDAKGAIENYPVPQSLSELYEQNPRHLGAPGAAKLIVAHTAWLAQQLQQVTDQRDELQDEVRRLEVSNARQDEQLSAERRSRTPRAVMITVGMALMGTGFKYLEAAPLSYILMLGGLALTVYAYTLKPTEGKA